MRNVHQRLFAATQDQVRSILDHVWTGTRLDVFPRDVIPSWRRNPPGVAPLASVPGQTEVGHGPFRFRLTQWDGQKWRVSIGNGGSTGMAGWHGFDLVPQADGSSLTHTTEIALRGPARILWPLIIAPMHNWAVEALFDRLEAALHGGQVPAHTSRPIPWHVRVLLRLGDIATRRGRGARSRQQRDMQAG